MTENWPKGIVIFVIIFMRKISIFFLLHLLALLAVTSQVKAQTQSPKFEILTPSSDQVIYGNRIPTLFLVENFTLVESKDKNLPVNSQGHILVWLDSNPASGTGTKVTQDTFTFADVAAGEHKITAELVNADGQSLNPKQTLIVNFKSEPLASPAEPKEAGFDKNTTLVIFLIVALVIVAAWWYTKDEEEKPEKETLKTRTKTRRSKARKKSKA